MKFQFGNQESLKWDKEKTQAKLEEFANFVFENEFTSLNQACFAFEMLPSMFQYLCNRHPDLEYIKKDIMAFISQDINDKAIRGKLKETMTIFRLKLLGENVEEVVRNKNTNINMNSEPFTKEQIEEAKRKLDDDY